MEFKFIFSFPEIEDLENITISANESSMVNNILTLTTSTFPKPKDYEEFKGWEICEVTGDMQLHGIAPLLTTNNTLTFTFTDATISSNKTIYTTYIDCKMKWMPSVLMDLYWDDNYEDSDSGGSVINTYNIVTNLAYCWAPSTNATQIDEGSEVVLYFYPYSSYSLPISISVIGAEYSWYSSSGMLTLWNPSATVYISISAYYDTPCCFVAGTPILMSNGTFKYIEDMIEGDTVMTYNEQTHIYEPGIVTAFITKTNTRDMAHLIFENNMEIVMNAYHPLYTQEGWKSLVQFDDMGILTENDSILSINNQWIKISEILRWNSEEDIISYNLNVENNDNFFVGYTPIMVHNAEFVPSICSSKPDLIL